MILQTDGWSLRFPFGVESTHCASAAQRVAYYDPARILVVQGGIGTGKSHLGCRAILRHMLRHRGVRGAVVGRDYAQLRPAVIERILLPMLGSLRWESGGESRPWREGLDWIWRRSDHTLELPRWTDDTGTPSSAIFLGEDAGALRSHTWPWIWADEVALWRRDSWVHLLGRWRGERLIQLLVTTTVEHAATWWQREVRSLRDDPECSVHTVSTYDAHWLDPAYVRGLERRYTDAERRVYLLGEEGVDLATPDRAYPRWSSRWIWAPGDPDECPDPVGEAPIRCAVDWGGTNLAVVLAQHRGETRYVFDEVDLPGETVAAYAGEVARRCIEGWTHDRGRQVREVWITGDPAGARDNLGYEESRLDVFHRVLREHGVESWARLPSSAPRVRTRLEVVNEQLALGRVRVHERCERLIEDRRSVSRRRSAGSDPRDVTLDKGSDGRYTHYSDADDLCIWREWGLADVSGAEAVVISPDRPAAPWEVITRDSDDRPARDLFL